MCIVLDHVSRPVGAFFGTLRKYRLSLAALPIARRCWALGNAPAKRILGDDRLMNKMPAQLDLTNASANSITRRRFVTLAAGSATVALAPISRVRAQAVGVIKIGHIQPLTGPSAAYGIRATRRGHHRGRRNQCRGAVGPTPPARSIRSR